MINELDDLIPNFKTHQDAISFLKLKKHYKCIECHGKKEQNNGNRFLCNKCIAKHKEKRQELKKSQNYYKENPQMIPKEIQKQLWGEVRF